MTANKRILLVDDDEALRSALAEQLTLHEEFVVVESGTGQDAMDKAKEGQFDMVLLDVGLPDLDGREVCRMMRRANVNVPILMLTGADSDLIKFWASIRAPTTTSSSRSSWAFSWPGSELNCASTSKAKTPPS